jgi:hypothetical protein
MRLCVGDAPTGVVYGDCADVELYVGSACSQSCLQAALECIKV